MNVHRAFVMAIIVTLGGVAGRADGQLSTVIFSAADYQHLEKAPLLAEAAEAWRLQLTPVQEVAVPIAPTSANFRRELAALKSAEPVETLLLVVLAYGVQIGGVDYICCEDTTLDDIKRLQQSSSRVQPGTLVSMKEIVRQVSLAKCRQQVVIVDTGRLSPLPEKLASVARPMIEAFGTQTLSIPANQWLIINRSGKTAGPGQTVFGNAVLSGLTANGDGNGNGKVTVFELTDYLRAYAQQERITMPTMKVRAKVNFDLITASADAVARFPADVGRKMTERMLSAARRLLLVESQTDAAREALETASRFADRPAELREIEMLELTIRAMSGDVQGALADAGKKKLPLLVTVPARSNVYQNFAPQWQHVQLRFRVVQQQVDPIVSITSPNTVRQITAVKGNRFYSHSVQVAKLQSRSIEYRPAAKPDRGWQELSSFQQSGAEAFQSNLMNSLHQDGAQR